MTSVPAYLEPYSADVLIKNDTTSFSLKCVCGCDSFLLYKNVFSEEEKREMERYEANCPKLRLHTLHGGTGKDGKPYAYIRILGIFKKHIVLPRAPFFAGIKVIKALCASCGEEVVVFDSRIHGNALTDVSYEAVAYAPHFEEENRDPCHVFVEIERSEEDEAETPFVSSIVVHAKRHGRKRIVFEYES